MPFYHMSRVVSPQSRHNSSSLHRNSLGLHFHTIYSVWLLCSITSGVQYRHQHLYSLQCDHLTRSSNHLSPCKLTAILLTIFPFTFAPIRLPLTLATTTLISVSMSLFLFCSLFESTCKRNYTAFVFLCLTYFTYYNAFYVYSHCHKWQGFDLFYC